VLLGTSLRSPSLEHAANKKGNAKVVRVERLECVDGFPEARAMGEVRK
jgi:hypothetical protein